MKTTRFIAIRQKSTGFFLPARSSYGFTHDEPVPPDESPPRLFRERRAASNALTAWLCGKWTTRPTPTDGASIIDFTPQYERDHKDMELVTIYLTVEPLEVTALRDI